MSEERYIPAAGRGLLTGLYDPVIALTMRERTFRGRLERRILAAAARSPRVVDVGCGTGTLAISLAHRLGDGVVVGIDGDPAVLTRARQKPGADRVTWTEGRADRLPLAGDSVDIVVMSLLLHHLVPNVKEDALREAARVLKPGGALHIADWGRPGDPVMRVAFHALQLVDGREGTAPHARGEIPSFLKVAGFGHVVVHDRLRTVWGVLELLSAHLSPDFKSEIREPTLDEPTAAPGRRDMG